MKWCATGAGSSGKRTRTNVGIASPGPGDTWHLDEVFLSINGERHYLWRAIDRDGHVLDILVRRRRDTHAAKRCFRHLLKGLTDIPRGIITDKLRSYSAAKREMLPSVDHRQQHYLNNRAENSHQPTRQRERRMPRFTSPWPRTTVPLCLWADRLPFPSQTSPAACPGLPPGNAATISGLARGDRHTASGLKDTGGSTLSLRGLVIALDSVNLTKPGIARSAVAI